METSTQPRYPPRHVVHQVNPVVQTVDPNVESAFHLGSIFHRVSRVPNPPQPNMAVLGSASVLQSGGIRHAEARAPPGWVGGFERTHSSIRGSNRKGIALLSYHRFLEPPPWYRYFSSVLRLPPRLSVVVTGSSNLASMVTLLFGRSFPERCCFMRTQTGLTGYER